MSFAGPLGVDEIAELDVTVERHVSLQRYCVFRQMSKEKSAMSLQALWLFVSTLGETAPLRSGCVGCDARMISCSVFLPLTGS